MRSFEEVAKFTEGARIDPIPFDKSEFVMTENKAYKLAKSVLDRILIPESTIEFRVTHGGQVTATAKKSVVNDEKKISFCSDFPVMMNGIIGLLAYEVAKNLMYHHGAYRFAKILLSEISDAMSYEELKFILIQLHNLLRETASKKCNTGSIPFGIARSEKSFEEIYETSMRIVQDGISSGTNSSFESDRRAIQAEMDNYVYSISNIVHTISYVDDLCFNAGQFSVGNTTSFLKMFELILRSAAIDTNDISSVQNYVDHTLSIEGGNLASYVNFFNKHFQEISSKTQTTLMSDVELENDISHVHLVLKPTLFAELGTLAAVGIVRVCRMIANTRLSYIINDGRSTRIQFFQVFQALLQSTVSIDIDLDRFDLFALYHCLTSSRQMKSRSKKANAVKTAEREPEPDTTEVDPTETDAEE